VNHTEKFLSEFSSLFDGFMLPERVSVAYDPVSALSRKEGRMVLLMRRRRDGALFVLKSGPSADMEAEYKILSRLAPVLPGAVPEPVGCFCEDGVGYLLRSYLLGETLVQYRERMKGCAPEKCGVIGQKLCALMEILHSQEPPIIHRDIKPENVIILADGGLGLIDFGTARFYMPGQETDTRHLGTCTTAAPEQYGYAQTDSRTDLYAAGVTLLWLATGTYDRSALPGLPGWLRRTLGKAMAFDPAGRFSSAENMRDALARKFPWKKAVLSVLAAACVLLAFCGVLSHRTPQKTDPVEFSSKMLEAAVRAELEMPEGVVTYGDLERVERLAVLGTETFDENQPFDCRVVPYVGDALKDGVPRGDVDDLSLLARMPNLRELYLCRQQITDISPLEGLPVITLALYDNNIADVTPLKDAVFLERLYLGTNPAVDYGALSGLPRLYYLNLDSLDGAYVDSFSFLTDMGLEELSICRLQPADGDWAPLSGLGRLHTIHLQDAPETAVAAVHDLPNLICITAGNWQGGDLSSVAGMTELESLNVYDGLESFAGAETLAGLEILYVTGDGPTDIAPLTGLPKLRRVELYGMPIEDFSPLSSLESLEELGLNPELEEAAYPALPEGVELIVP